MSFFDEDDEPLRTTQKTRTRSAPPPRRGRVVSGGSGGGEQSIMVRRLVAGIIGALVVLVLFLVVRACNDSRHENALKDYNRQVSGIATQSRQTGDEFFKLMSQAPAQSPQDLYNQILGFKGTAETALTQAREINPPDDMRSAQQALLMSLEMRRDGLDSVASRIKPALGDEGETVDKAINEIAAQMKMFTASDVLYESRVTPFILDAFKQAEIGGQNIEPSTFMPEPAWQSPEYVAAKLDQNLSASEEGDGEEGGSNGEPTGPGLHGTGLNGTSYGELTLQPATSNRLTYVEGQPFTVSFTNQGDNDEFRVRVTLKIARESGGNPITINKTVPRILKGEQITVTMPLKKKPPIDTVVTISVTVQAVPGEEKTDNNKASYPSLFVEG